MNTEISVSISAAPLDIAAAIGAAGTVDTGATGAFVGTVRATPSEDAEKQVLRLDYEAHPTLAEDALRTVALQAAEKWPLARVVALHRTGSCELGEATVVIACSAQHRAEALDACRWIIDEVKATVPIWKKEIYTDGSSWVGAH